MWEAQSKEAASIYLQKGTISFLAIFNFFYLHLFRTRLETDAKKYIYFQKVRLAVKKTTFKSTVIEYGSKPIQPCSLYPSLPVIFLPAQNFKSWTVWQNENHSVAAEP